MLIAKKSNALYPTQSHGESELRTNCEGNEKAVYGACGELQS